MTHTFYSRLSSKLGALYGMSFYGALLAVVLGGLVIPALIGGYLLIGVHEQQSAQARLNEALQRNADILALGLQESLWNMNAESARALLESVMRERSVRQVRVTSQSATPFMQADSKQPALGTVYRAERAIMAHGQSIGRVQVEMDDARSMQYLHEKQIAYGVVLAAQLGVSLLFIVLFLNQRLLQPLRKLMGFSDRLARGDFETPLALAGSDELGRLATQLEQMRVAIKRLFEDIGQREERFRTIVMQVPGAVFRCSPNGQVDFVSAAIEAISGYGAGWFMASPCGAWSRLIVPEDRNRHRRTVLRALRDGLPYAIEYRILNAARGQVWVAENGQPHACRDGAQPWVDGIIVDICERKEAEKKLDHLAHHDPLTGLPNRLLFHDRLLLAQQRATRAKEQMALLFIDLDRFKNVNDSLGHHIGDELLRLVAGELAARLRAGDTLARLGGDEFIVLLEDADHSCAGAVAEKMVAMFEQPFVVAEHELYVTCSIGISLFPQDAVDLNMLIRNADAAMYQAKARGRNGFQFYAASMTEQGVERLQLETCLRRSIEKNEISLHYQPQVEIGSTRLIGVEALVRWTHPELGQVPPVRFIPLAEDTGFINQLGKWVLFEACRQMVRWDRAGLQVPKIAVNLSVKQFERGSIVNMVADILAETGLAPGRLQLEVTESVIMNTGDALAYIDGLHAIGVGLAIDDFGTGYSSLAYLKQMPVQTLKIDRSFIKDLSTDVNDEAITIAIIALGKSLNLSVIAEGVETEEQAEFLARNGCKLAQGYLYSRPVLPQDLLERWHPDVAHAV